MHRYGGIPGGDLGTGLTIIGTGGDLTTIRGIIPGDLIMTPGTVLGDLMIPGTAPGLVPVLITLILTIPVMAQEALMSPAQM